MWETFKPIDITRYLYGYTLHYFLGIQKSGGYKKRVRRESLYN